MTASDRGGRLSPKAASSIAASIVREVLAIILWVYVLVKLWVFDIDIYIAHAYFPNLAWILNFRFFVFIGIIALVILLVRRSTAMQWIGFVVAYPLIIVLWRVPIWVLKSQNWLLGFAILNSTISFFRSLRYNVMSLALWSISTVLIITADNRLILLPSIATIAALLVAAYVQRLIQVFRPIALSELYNTVFASTGSFVSKTYKLDETIRNLPVASLDKSQLQEWSSSLSTAVLFNRICLFVARKIRDYQASGLTIISGVFSSLFLVVLTTFAFAAINFGLHKIDQTQFEYVNEPSFFTFFYYSFNTLVFNSINELSPTQVTSQSIGMVEGFFAFFLAAIFVSLAVSIRSQRYSEELNRVVSSIEVQGEIMEAFIRSEYNIHTVDEAMAELERLGAGFAQVLYYLSGKLK